MLLNDVNYSYNFVRFYLDDDNTIAVAVDLNIKPTRESMDIVTESISDLVILLNAAWPNLAPFVPAA